MLVFESAVSTAVKRGTAVALITLRMINHTIIQAAFLCKKVSLRIQQHMPVDSVCIDLFLAMRCLNAFPCMDVRYVLVAQHGCCLVT